MNHKRRCIFGMRYLKNSDFIVRARLIQTKLSEPLFSSVVPSPAAVMPMLNQLDIWLSESMMKDYRNVSARNALRAKLNDMVSAQCTSVNAIAQNDVNVMIKSGFDLMRMPVTASLPEPTSIKWIKSLDEGTIKIRLKRVPDYRFYEIEINGAEGFVRHEASTVSTAEIPNLPTGVRLFIVARAVNSKGRGPWSAPRAFVVNIRP